MKNFLYKAYKWSNSWTGTIVIVLFVIFFIAQAFRIPSGSMKDSLLIGDHLFAKKFAYGIPMPYIPFLEVPIIPWSDKLKIIDGAKPKRGDIVIFRYPRNIKQHFVKRCVALEDDELFIDNKNLYIHFREGDEWIKKHYPKENIIVRDGRLWVKNPYMKQHPGIHHDQRMTKTSYTVVSPGGQFVDIVSEHDYITNNYKIKANEQIAPTAALVPPVYYTNIIKVPKGRYFMMGDNRDHSNDSRFWGAVPYENIEGTPWFIYFSITDDWEIRWDRVGKTPTDLEEPYHLNKAIQERKKQEHKFHGLT